MSCPRCGSTKISILITLSDKKELRCNNCGNVWIVIINTKTGENK